MASHQTQHVSTHSVQSLLEKMTSSDKDFRFMAANDLMGQLQTENISLDEESEQKVVKMLMRLLEDKNGEVQNLAVRCLGPLANKVKDSQVETIINTLCTNLLSDNEQVRDISSMGLKTVISELPTNRSSMIQIISRELNPKLVEAIANAKDVSVQLESIDILTDLLMRIGSQLQSYHGQIKSSLFKQLNSDRLAVRKRAMIALSQLMVSCSLELYNESMTQIFEHLKQIIPSNDQEIANFPLGQKYSTSRTLLQCTACIVRAAGHRSTEMLDNFIPIIEKFCLVPDDELREFCLQAFEAFVRRCTHEIVRYLPGVIKICLDAIAYDPNYNYEDNDDEDMEMDGPDDDAEGDSAEEYSDDDDMSWKVRRASAKCLESIISARQDMVAEFYVTIAPTLVSRFKEREESVKVDILQAFIALLRQTRPLASAKNEKNIKNSTKKQQEQNEPLPIVKLREMIPTIVSKATHQLREKAIKTRQSMFNVLIEIMHVIPGALADHIASLMPGILYSMADKNSTSSMKIDALSFVDGLLRQHPPQVFHPHIQVILPAVANAVSDPFYKISSEALMVMTQLVRVIRPLGTKDNTGVSNEPMANFQSYIPVIYAKTYEKISASDVDQEVKERAISCMGQVIATFGDYMDEQLPVALPLLMDRLNNEITRLTCVKALTTITNSPLNISLERLFPDAFLILASFLRKNQRSLKLNTLVLLDATIKRAAYLLDSRSVEHILVETPMLINETDLHVSQLTLNILSSIIRTHKAFLPIVPQTILPEALQLIRSPLLQGSALKSMLEFFSTIVQSSFPGLDHNALYTRLIEPIYKGMALHKQAYSSTAKAVAAISVHDPNRAYQTVRQLLPDMRTYKDKETIHSLGLLIIGEIGKTIDLGSVENLCETILDAFSSAHEDVKSAASYSLGSVAVGNLQQFLPVIMQEIEARNRRQYLLLHSLREVITCGFVDDQVIDLHLEPIWELLVKHCECPEEGTRNVVAECLGKLTLLRPGQLLSRLRLYLHSDFAQSPLARSTVVTAIKFTISDQPQEIDELLRSNLEDFLVTLQDEDITVRRVALVTFNSAAHHKPSLIRDLLPQVLPRLYAETKVKPELIREVEMGPFKHTIDDGLDLRKAAFECMYTLLDTCQAQLDIFEFLSHVESGLKDHYDIKMLTYLMLVRLATLCPSAVLQRLDGLVEPIRSVCDIVPRTCSVKQEFEKQDELKRSALRAFNSLRSIPDAGKNLVVSNFIQKIEKDPVLLALSTQRDTQQPNTNTTGSSGSFDNNSMDVN